MREIIIDRKNGTKAFVLFDLTKGNIAEIKDRYILKQMKAAIDNPWNTTLPVAIHSALVNSVSEELEDRLLLNSMNRDINTGVKDAIKNAVNEIKGKHGIKNGLWADVYKDADVLDYAYQEIFRQFDEDTGARLDEVEIPDGYRIISGKKWADGLSEIGREWIDDIKPFLLLADRTGSLMICDILRKQTLPVVAVKSDFAKRFSDLADGDGMIGDRFWTHACIAEAQGHKMTFDFRNGISKTFGLNGWVENSDSDGRVDGNLSVKGEIARVGADKLAEEAKKKNELLRDG